MTGLREAGASAQRGTITSPRQGRFVPSGALQRFCSEQPVALLFLLPPFFFLLLTGERLVVEPTVLGAGGIPVMLPAPVLQVRGNLPQAQAGGLSLVDARMIFGGPIQAPLWGLPPLCGRKEAYSRGCSGCFIGVGVVR